MNFYLDDSNIKKEYPYCTLERSDWNDWGYYATFFLTLHFSSTQKQNFGAIKIGKQGLSVPDYYKNQSETVTMEKSFDHLSDNYFSVGVSSQYYLSMYTLSVNNKEIFRKILIGLRDIVYEPKNYEKNKNEDIFKKALTRNNSKKTIKDVYTKALKIGHEELTSYNFAIELKNDVGAVPMTFSVSPKLLPQTNIHTIIGRNGVGKTNLFKSIITTLCDVPDTTHSNIITKFDGKSTISSVLALSYSVFDTTLPKQNSLNGEITYKFIGFNNQNTETENNLEFEDWIVNNFLSVVDAIKVDTSVHNVLTQSIETLNSDPMFNSLDVLDWFSQKNIDNIEVLFRKLSSGHKIVLLSLLQIINNVEPNSLFLIDEPEQNLHPPLISSFFQAILVVLRDRNAVALIATHSPVIVQECSADSVWIMDRSYSSVSISRPTIETFGENVGKITYDVFDLEVVNSGYMKIVNDEVNKLKKDQNFNDDADLNKKLEKIIEIFNDKLGDELITKLASMLSPHRE